MAIADRFSVSNPNEAALSYEPTKEQYHTLERALGGAKKLDPSLEPDVIPVPVPQAARDELMELWREYLFEATATKTAIQIKPYKDAAKRANSAAAGFFAYGRTRRWSQFDSQATADTDAERVQDAKTEIELVAAKKAHNKSAARAAADAEFDTMFEVGLGLARPVQTYGFEIEVPDDAPDVVREYLRGNGVSIRLNPRLIGEVTDRVSGALDVASNAAPESGLVPGKAHGPTLKKIRVWARKHKLPTNYSRQPGNKAGVLAYMAYRLFEMYAQYDGVYRPGDADALVGFMTGDLPETDN